jgi:hypothetical protein
MSARLLDIYKSILSFAAMKIDDKGIIYTHLCEVDDATRRPIDINGEQLVFPIKSQFADPNQSKFYFHPLSESFIRGGESEVLGILKEHIQLRLNFVFANEVNYMLRLLASPKLHAKLGEEQAELLKHISGGDDKTQEHWQSLMMRFASSEGLSAGPYLRIFLRKSGTLRGETYGRVGVVTFPFYQDLIAGKFDGKHGLRKKDLEIFRKIIEFIFPNINDVKTGKSSEEYNYGTRTRVAPFLDALMMTGARLAQRLNEMNEIYHDFIDDADYMVFDMKWTADFQDLDALNPDIKALPDGLKGNQGRTSVADQNHAPVSLDQSKTIAAQAPVPEPRHTVAAPAPQAQTEQQFTNAGPGQQATQQSPAPPVIREHDGKLNFTDMMRVNPTLSATHQQVVANQIPPEVLAFFNTYGQWPPGFIPPGMPPMAGPMANTMPTWAMRPIGPQPTMMQPQYMPQQGAPGVPMGYMQQPPMMIQPQMMVPPGMQPPPPGLQYMWDQSRNSWVLVPIQQAGVQYPVNTGQMPPGWYPR